MFQLPPLCTKPLFLSFSARLLVFTILISAFANTAMSTDQLNCEQLVVGGFADLSPISYINPKTNQPEGTGYELMRLIAAHLNTPITIKANLPAARIINMAQAGELDVIAGLTANTFRLTFLIFSKPIYHDDLYIYTHVDNTMNPTELDHLANYTRVDVRGASAGEKIDKRLVDSTVIVNNEREMMALISSRRADYFLASEQQFSHLREKFDTVKKIRRGKQPIATLEVGLAIAKKSPCVKHLTEFNQVIEEQLGRF
jgi:ABC-type amino acid transport substrate-binding protein